MVNLLYELEKMNPPEMQNNEIGINNILFAQSKKKAKSLQCQPKFEGLRYARYRKSSKETRGSYSFFEGPNAGQTLCSQRCDYSQKVRKSPAVYYMIKVNMV